MTCLKIQCGITPTYLCMLPFYAELPAFADQLSDGFSPQRRFAFAIAAEACWLPDRRASRNGSCVRRGQRRGMCDREAAVPSYQLG
jgi:hypothetical protein